MREPAVSWPAVAPGYGRVVLREFRETDTEVVVELSYDPYVPQVTSLVPRATVEQAAEWIVRQTGRLAQGVGFSFAIADAATGRALGQIGLWFDDLPDGRCSAGYLVAPKERGHGIAADALAALTRFAWTIPDVHRVELYIEPWNTASVRTAERVGYQREGLLRSYRTIGDSRSDMLLYAVIRPG